MPRSNEQWVADLRGPHGEPDDGVDGDAHDDVRRNAASSDLREILRGTLARGFGRQLSDADLDDLSQQSVLRTIERLESFRGDSRFTTWAASIAVNAALGELRRRRHAESSLDDAIAAGRSALEQAPGAVVRLQREDAARVLRQAIDEALTPTQRDALLAELGGLPLMEIARRTGRKRGALYKLLHDARKRLRAHLEGHGLTAADLIDYDQGRDQGRGASEVTP
ncbi:MAG: sigma-70 family RNA polymerase sigma factor [Myxococcota bacterium]